MVEACGSDHYLFTNLPIDSFANGELTVSCVDGGGNGGPGDCPWCTIHAELTVEATDSFISEERLLFSVVATVHDEGQFTIVRVLLCTCDELATIHGDETSLHCQVHSIFEDKSATLNSNALKNRCALIY